MDPSRRPAGQILPTGAPGAWGPDAAGVRGLGLGTRLKTEAVGCCSGGLLTRQPLAFPPMGSEHRWRCQPQTQPGNESRNPRDGSHGKSQSWVRPQNETPSVPTQGAQPPHPRSISQLPRFSPPRSESKVRSRPPGRVSGKASRADQQQRKARQPLPLCFRHMSGRPGTARSPRKASSWEEKDGDKCTKKKKKKPEETEQILRLTYVGMSARILYP